MRWFHVIFWKKAVANFCKFLSVKFIAKNFRQISNTIFVHKNSFLGLNFVQVHLTQMHLIRSNSSRLDIMDVGRRHYNDDSSFIKWCGIEKEDASRISRTFSTCFCTYLAVLLWVHFHEKKKCNQCNFWQKRGAFSSPFFCVLATTTCFLISFQWKKFRVPAKDASYFSRKFQTTFLLNCKFVLFYHKLLESTTLATPKMRYPDKEKYSWCIVFCGWGMSFWISLCTKRRKPRRYPTSDNISLLWLFRPHLDMAQTVVT